MARRKLLVADLLCGAALDPLQVAWAAGLIEGEGSFHASVRSQRAHEGSNIAYRIRVVMTDEDVLLRLRNVFGVGNVVPYRNTQGLGKKQLYRWEANRRHDVVAICDALYPLMGERRRSQIDRLRALLAAHPPVPGSERSRRTWVTRRRLAAEARAGA